jgi:hypothetical protein
MGKKQGEWTSRPGCMGPSALALVALIVSMLGGCDDCQTQIPVDVKPFIPVAKWVTIFDQFSPQIVGYVLVTGSATSGDPLETTKGNFAIASGKEYWFASNNESLEADPRTLRGVKWSVQSVIGFSWRDTMTEFIDESAGLVDSGDDVPWDLRALSGSVPWSTPGPGAMDDTTAFEYSDGATTWHLALARDDDVFTKVVWGSTKPSGQFTLPGVFGDPTSTPLTRVRSASPASVFDAHESP